MIVKQHKSGDKIIIAICDKELIGQKFTESRLQLDLTSDFYNGTEIDELEVLDLINNAYIINAVGNNTIKFLIQNKVISEFKTIQKIPYVQVLLA